MTARPGPSLGRRCWLAAGGAAAVLAWAFVGGGLGSVVHATAAAAVLVVLPAAALGQQLPLEFDLGQRRLEAYASSIVALTVLGLAALWLAEGLPAQADAWATPSLGRPGSGGRLAQGGWTTLLAAAGVLTAGGLVVVYAFKAASPVFGWKESAVVREIIPATPTEKALFALLAVAAGVFEEIVFRGFLPAFLVPWTGSYVLAALPAAVAFGLLHAYQGPHGMVRTGLLGVWLALGAGWTGSLWPSIFAHVALDLLIGLALAPSLVGKSQEDPLPST